MQHKYRKVVAIEYNERRFQVFRDERGRYAFLRIGEDNQFHYPVIEDLIGLIQIFSNRPKGIMYYKGSENQPKKRKGATKYKIAISALVLAQVVACSSALFKEISKTTGINYEDIEQTISMSDDYDVKKDYSNIKVDLDNKTVSYVGESNESEKEEEPEEEEEIVLSTSIVDLSNGYKIPENYVKPNNTFDDSQIEQYSKHQVVILDYSALSKYIGYSDVTYEQIIEAIDANYRIPSEYREEIKKFTKEMMDYYPGIDMRIFYENVKDMDLQYVENNQDQAAKLDPGVEAWYDYTGNTIYISRHLKLEEGTHDIMVFRHEIAHALNLAKIVTDDQVIYCSMQFHNFGYEFQEACNVLITTYPFIDRYEDKNLGWPLVSNEVRLILEATPGFDPRDLITHNILYFQELLDTNNKTDIKSQELIDLLEAQTTEYYYGSAFNTYNDEYSKIYKYIADVYINNVFNDSMSEEEINEYREYLKTELTKCLKDTSLVRTEVIDEEIDNYLQNRVSKAK